MKTICILLCCISLFVSSSQGQTNALTFDGVDDYVTIPARSSNDLSYGTVECIVKPTSFGNKLCILGVRGTGGTRFSFHMSQGSIGISNGYFYDSLAYSFTAGNTYQLAFVAEGYNVYFYVNGALIGHTPHKFSDASGQPLVIGAVKEWGNPEQVFAGAIDEVRLWNAIRTADDIMENKDVSLSGSEAGLVALYKFDQGTAGGTNTSQTTLLDNTAAHNNGTLANFALTGSSSNYTANVLNTGASTTLPWLMGGNAGTASTTNYIGTSDFRRLVFKSNNVERMSLFPNGNLGVGTSSAPSILTIKQQLDGSGIELQSPAGDYSANYIKLGTNPAFPFINAMWSNARLDISAGTDLFLFGTNIFFSGNAVVTRSGDATSLETSKSSRTMPFESRLWNGTEGILVFAGLQNIASTTVSLAHRLAFKTGARNTDLSDGTEVLSVLSDGTVGINTTDTKNYKLAVNGSAIFTKVVVKLYNTWPDYVFSNNYQLPSLEQIEEYIKTNHHLQDMPSAEDVEKNGIDLGSNQALLLKKVEELTLYLIEQNNKITEQQKDIQELKKKLLDRAEK